MPGEPRIPLGTLRCEGTDAEFLCAEAIVSGLTLAIRVGAVGPSPATHAVLTF